MRYGRSVAYGVLVGLGLALVFSLGFIVRDMMDMPSVFAATSAQQVQEPGYPLLDEVQDLLDQHYLRDQPSYQERQYAAVRGMLNALDDRNTFFIEPVVAQSESDALAGTYGGIGVTVQRNADGAFVLYPFDDGPATAAGILDGDILRSVDGEQLDSSTSPNGVDQKLRGLVEDGNGVELVVTRNEADLTFFVPFDVINIPSVQWRVLDADDRIGYIQVLRFTSRTPDEMTQAIDELFSAEVDALVLDLRDNFGGLLQESVDVAGLFLDGGVILYEVRADDERIFEAQNESLSLDRPMVVLVNSGTASASELLAGALQDRDRATLIGQTTYGKGTIQQIFPLSDQSSVHITSAEWLTPNRNQIDSIGLEPDIPMIPDAEGRDVEIEEAIRYLQSQLDE